MNKKDIKQSVLILICIIITVLSVTLISNAVTTISTDITTGGNVGIGTTTPNWSLQSAGTEPVMALTDTSAGVNDKHWLFQSLGGHLFIGTSTDDLSATSSYMTIDNNGNVGIGRVNPNESLHIHVPAYGRKGIFIGESTENGGGIIYDEMRNALELVGENGGSESLGIAIPRASGNVGIGTTSPDAILDIGKTAASHNDLFMISSSTAGDLLTVNRNGNVGIGTTSPAALFDMFSTVTTTMTIDSNNAAKGSCLKLKDVDGGGYTYCYVLDGNINCSTDSCE